MTAWQAVREGQKLLRARWGATLAALLGSTAALLGLEAGARFAGAAWARALGELDLVAGLRAVAITLTGLALAALLTDLARAAALVAYADPEGRPLRDGLARVPRLITVRAVELTIETTLGVGALLVLLRAGTLALAPWRAALVGALASAPVLGLLLATFAATRVAMIEAARGTPAATALARGFRTAFARLPELVRLGGAILLATLPLWALAFALAMAAHRAGGPAGLALATARDGALALGALWGYAALARLVDAGGSR